MRHHDVGVHAPEPGPECQGQSGVEPHGRGAVPAVGQRGIDPDLVGTLGQAEHPVGPDAGPVQTVGQGPRLTLGASGTGRGDDVQDQGHVE